MTNRNSLSYSLASNDFGNPKSDTQCRLSGESLACRLGQCFCLRQRSPPESRTPLKPFLKKAILEAAFEIHDNANGLNYMRIGDYYLPMLTAPESPKVGPFEKAHFHYLKV